MTYQVTIRGRAHRAWVRAGAAIALGAAMAAGGIAVYDLGRYHALSRRVATLAREARPAWATCAEWRAMPVDDRMDAGEYLLVVLRTARGRLTLDPPTPQQIATVVGAADSWCARVDDDRLAARAVRTAYERDESLRG